MFSKLTLSGLLLAAMASAAVVETTFPVKCALNDLECIAKATRLIADANKNQNQARSLSLSLLDKRANAARAAQCNSEHDACELFFDHCCPGLACVGHTSWTPGVCIVPSA